MAAVHLTKTYCLPTLVYGCEIWTFTDNCLHTISVAWNNCFRRILSDVGVRALNLFSFSRLVCWSSTRGAPVSSYL